MEGLVLNQGELVLSQENRETGRVSASTEEVASVSHDLSQRKSLLKTYARKNRIKQDLCNEVLIISKEKRFLKKYTRRNRITQDVRNEGLFLKKYTRRIRRISKKTHISFGERVRLFISRMQIVQGAREFSPWKGSVMDTIGGAFLTQNVNDTLSSSAFMSLAAKYPHQAVKQKLDGKNASCSSSSEARNDNRLPMNGKNIGSQGVKKRKSSKRLKMKSNAIEWRNLRTLYSKGSGGKEIYQLVQSVDWEAVRMADVKDIAKAIERRGMNNNLAERIKNFLNNVWRQLGEVDLEWLRDVPPDITKEYLLKVPGLGLKSVECIRLLTLLQKAFPIDTNAGRVAVRLGWIPLEPLPEGQEFHLLKEYPKLNSVQMYLWPLVSELNESVQYELNCQLITFAKVFCTKRDPNCKACPMRDECKHYASSQASSRQLVIRSGNKPSEYVSAKYKPEVDFSKSHTLDSGRHIERDIEDFGLDEVPRVDIDLEELTKRMQNFINEKNRKEGDIRSLVVPNSEAVPIPVRIMNKKIVARTEHQVYVLPDSHSILKGFPQRVDNESCPYLFAVWTRDERLNIKDDEYRLEQTVSGTILIPVRTAVAGAFPLNGTYFQANEVFADDESSKFPISVPKESVWNLPRTTLYCGKSMSALCKGMGTFDVQECFWRGYVCFRGYDRKIGEPKILSSQFHKSVTKLKTTTKGGQRKKKKTAVELPKRRLGRPKKLTELEINVDPPKKRGRPKKTACSVPR